jgi:hypothetical protein
MQLISDYPLNFRLPLNIEERFTPGICRPAGFLSSPDVPARKAADFLYQEKRRSVLNVAPDPGRRTRNTCGLRSRLGVSRALTTR